MHKGLSMDMKKTLKYRERSVVISMFGISSMIFVGIKRE